MMFAIDYVDVKIGEFFSFMNDRLNGDELSLVISGSIYEISSDNKFSSAVIDLTPSFPRFDFIGWFLLVGFLSFGGLSWWLLIPFVFLSSWILFQPKFYYWVFCKGLRKRGVCEKPVLIPLEVLTKRLLDNGTDRSIRVFEE